MAENSKETANQAEPSPAEGRRRGKGRPFEKGVCPNPGGRPKESEEYKDAMARLDVKAIAGLEKILDNAKHKKFAEVCIYVVNRNHGKPVESVELSNPDGSLTLQQVEFAIVEAKRVQEEEAAETKSEETPAQGSDDAAGPH